ncbi:MAG: hypothetical protein HY746_07670 [Elusimicrobia bacterium]|nr:hypothetical protein [Elusimicrobiota bacterium]
MGKILICLFLASAALSGVLFVSAVGQESLRAAAESGLFASAGSEFSATGFAADTSGSPQDIVVSSSGFPYSAADVPNVKRPVVISIVGLSFTELGLGKIEIKYLVNIFRFFTQAKSGDEAQFKHDLELRMKDIAMDQFDKKAPDNYLDNRLARMLPADRYTIEPIRWSRDPDESDAAVPLVEAEIKNSP